MCIEDRYTRYEYGHYLSIDTNRYAIGARGIDMIESIRESGPEQSSPSAAVLSYPIYDGHGNMVATLSRASGNSYSIGNERRFDVWGQLRDGSGGPSQKYCANLGHSEDYVSGLTYMRARYYEPKTGRFISEDPSRDGWNWYGYCRNDPVNLVDESGRSPTYVQLIRLFALVGAGALIANAYFEALEVMDAKTPWDLGIAIAECEGAVVCLGLGLCYSDGPIGMHDVAFAFALLGLFLTYIRDAALDAAVGGKGWGKVAVGATFAYTLILAGFLLADIIEGYKED